MHEFDQFSLVEADLANREAVDDTFRKHDFDRVVNLAAQAGVRYSLTHPRVYTESNIVGFLNILEACRHAKTPHLTYASSSSVYGGCTTMPFSTSDRVDHPLSLYAATKKSNELMAHTYSHLYGLPTTGLRFFTVYGPWGRPDMALFCSPKQSWRIVRSTYSTKARCAVISRLSMTSLKGLIGRPNRSRRLIRIGTATTPDPATSFAPYRLFNIGNNQPVELSHFIEVIEKSLGKEAKKNLMPMQPGDVPATFADIDALEQAVGFRPSTSIEDGVQQFIDWYREYYQV